MQEMIFHCTDTTALLTEWIMAKVKVELLDAVLCGNKSGGTRVSKILDLSFSLFISYTIYDLQDSILSRVVGF